MGPLVFPGIKGVGMDRRHARVHDRNEQVEQDGDRDEVVDVPHDQGGVAGHAPRATDHLWMARIKQGP